MVVPKNMFHFASRGVRTSTSRKGMGLAVGPAIRPPWPSPTTTAGCGIPRA